MRSELPLIYVCKIKLHYYFTHFELELTDNRLNFYLVFNLPLSDFNFIIRKSMFSKNA